MDGNTEVRIQNIFSVLHRYARTIEYKILREVGHY